MEIYLAWRGLSLPSDAPLRFHLACPRGAERLPAMLALMTDPLTGEPCGVHRTFLAPNGQGKAPGQAKMMAGRAGVVRLVPDAEVTMGLGLAEGIETSLAIMQRAGWRPVWAATSAGAIRTFPVLAGIEELTIFADADDKGAGVAAALACAECWSELARRVTVLEPPIGADFDSATGRAA
ncbi:toprim domain-containing protein [Roseomonas sp. 1311]|uniref:Toprim domain-containing protein n=1 Tax=Roseomonas marmotae TaxID=2768161 RepID=A0ABS3K7A8_9PROT|nr:toprim domain-containing protein [Roseomonas marmotae]